MGFFKKALNIDKYVSGPGYELGHSISSNSVSNIFGTGGDNINLLEEYSGYVWKCINVRSEEVASVNFMVQRRVGDKWQNDENHDFNKVLDGEDGTFDKAELLEADQVYKDMYGESFWYFSKGARGGKPYAVYLLDPSAMTVMVANDRVTGYVYQKDGDRVTFDLDEIVHYRIFNPANKWRGAGPMQKAGWFIRSNRYIVTYVNNFLENNAVPAGVVVAKGAVDDSDWKLFKEQWKASYGGIDNLGKTGFVRGQDLDFIKTGLSLGDVDYSKVMSSSRDDILAMFSMPKSKLGMYESFNKASAVTSDQMFEKTFTEKAVTRIVSKLTRKVLNWYGKQYRLGSDFQVMEDREIKLSETEKGVGVWMTINEAREQYGLTPLGKEYSQLKQDAPATVHAKGLLKVKLIEKKKTLTAKDKETFRKETEQIQLKHELSFVKAANKVLEVQKSKVLKQIEPKKAANATFDVETESKALGAEVLPILIEMAQQQGSHALDFASSEELDFDLTPVAKKMIADSIAKATKSLTEETQRLIAETVAEGINNGDSIAEIAKRIDDVYVDLLGIKQPGYRLETLSRTEVIKNSNAITELAYKQSGVVEKKEWFANPGHCQYCASLNGSTISLGSSFASEGSSVGGSNGGTYKVTYEDVKTPGLHPNCRCTIIPVIDDISLSNESVKEIEKVSVREIPNLLDGIETIDDKDLGCIMLDTVKLDIVSNVDDAQDDLVESTDRHSHKMGAVAESEPHITLLYGLLENGNVIKKNVDRALKGWTIKTAKIEEVGFFDTPDSYAVVAHIEKTKELVEGHERLTMLPNRQTFSEYRPHLTLAYVKKDADINKWVKALGAVYNGKRIKVTGINYGDKPESK